MYIVDDNPEWYLQMLADEVDGVQYDDRGQKVRWPVREWRAFWRATAEECAQTPAGRLAVRQGFAITTGQTRELGWLRHDIRRESRRGTWWAPAHGVLSPAIIEDTGPEGDRRRHAIEAAAAVLLHPDHFVTLQSAAIMYGLPTLAVPAAPTLISKADTTTGRREGGHFRTTPLRASRTTSWYGVPLFEASRAVADVARVDRASGLMAADAVLRERLGTAADFGRALDQCSGLPGVRQARDLLPLADGRSESALESLLRLRLLDDGFPPFELQVRVSATRGTYRVDFMFEKQRLIVEADGLSKYTDAEARREKVRETRLRGVMYRIERVTWEDVTVLWPLTRARLFAALAGL